MLSAAAAAISKNDAKLVTFTVYLGHAIETAARKLYFDISMTLARLVLGLVTLEGLVSTGLVFI